MPTHWNIQIGIQRVEVAPPVAPNKQYGPMPSSGEVRRDIIKVLDLAIVADTEDEAYERLARLLEASRPRKTAHQHTASCHGPIGELQCDDLDAPNNSKG